jgi:hypothetical protein
MEDFEMTNLIRLPPTTTMTAQQALESALVDTESGYLKDVLICGYDDNGDLFIRSSRLTCAEAFFLASKAARWAQEGGVD